MPDSQTTNLARTCRRCGKQLIFRTREGLAPTRKYCDSQCWRAHQCERRRATFWTKVREADGCWLWLGELSRTGYGVMYHNSKAHPAHRMAWLFTHGGIPPGLFVLHRCDNRACVRPEHLFVGTHQDNMIDMVTKNRQARGEKQGASKLTEGQVRQIRARYAQGDITKAALATEFSVTRRTIQVIVEGLGWRHLA